ncbi:hypothetical protein [Bosea sp. 2RAB26]|jgi:hypothetical protein|uniref:hypothetical protein n=1 Tax=Bosea sp. 2RAB26 TaxID=3237476 RepID=UPI003F8FCE0B
MLQILLAIGGGRVTKGRINRGAPEAIMGALYASVGYQIGLNGRSHAYDGRLGIKIW